MKLKKIKSASIILVGLFILGMLVIGYEIFMKKTYGMQKSTFDMTKVSYDVTLAIKENKISKPYPRSLTLIYTNNSDKEYSFGNIDSSLEKKDW